MPGLCLGCVVVPLVDDLGLCSSPSMPGLCLFVSHVDTVFMTPFTTLARETACPLLATDDSWGPGSHFRESINKLWTRAWVASMVALELGR